MERRWLYSNFLSFDNKCSHNIKNTVLIISMNSEFFLKTTGAGLLLSEKISRYLNIY